MSKELIVAILSVVAAAIGLIAAYIGRRKQHDVRIHAPSGSAAAEHCQIAADAVANDTRGKPTVQPTAARPLLRRRVSQKSKLLIVFAGEDHFSSRHDPYRYDRAEVKIDGRRVGKVLVVRKRPDEGGEPRPDEDGDR